MASVIDCDVLILGGGIAGLTCAMGLRDSGLRLILVEREPILGGRARSWRDPSTGDPIQLGPQVLYSDEPNLLRLLEVLGTVGNVRWGRDLASARGERRHPLRDLVRGAARSLVEVAAEWPVAELALSLREKDLLMLDRLDAASVLQALGVGATTKRRGWAALCRAVLGLPLVRASAGSLLRAYRRIAFRAPADEGYAPAGLGELFAPAVRRSLERAGHRVLTGARATALCVEEEHVSGVDLADGRRIRARHVVSSLPPQALGTLASPALAHRHPFLADLDWFEPVASVAVYLWLDRKVTDRARSMRAFAEPQLVREFFDYSNIFANHAAAPSLVATRLVDADRVSTWDEERIVQAVARELAEELPVVRDARVLHAAVHHVPITVEAPRPGYEARRPAGRTEIDGLILAGDWTRTGLPSSMESAAASGWRAAELIGQRIGLRKRLVQPSPRPPFLFQLIGVATRSSPLREWLLNRIEHGARRGAELASPRSEARSGPWRLPRPISI